MRWCNTHRNYHSDAVRWNPKCSMAPSAGAAFRGPALPSREGTLTADPELFCAYLAELEQLAEQFESGARNAASGDGLRLVARLQAIVRQFRAALAIPR